MYPIKLSFNQVVRRVSVPLPAGETKLSHDVLVDTALSLFPELQSVQGLITFLWSDDENDVVCCSSDEEVFEAVRVMESVGKTMYRFEVSLKKESKEASSSVPVSSKAIHTNVTCDVCGVHPIVGVRYKCTIRNDFDYCEKCEQASTPPYPTIKIYTPEQAPVAIFVAVNDDDEVRHSNFGEFNERFHGWGGWGRRGPGPHCRGRRGCGGGGRGGGGAANVPPPCPPPFQEFVGCPHPPHGHPIFGRPPCGAFPGPTHPHPHGPHGHPIFGRVGGRGFGRCTRNNVNVEGKNTSQATASSQPDAPFADLIEQSMEAFLSAVNTTAPAATAVPVESKPEVKKTELESMDEQILAEILRESLAEAEVEDIIKADVCDAPAASVAPAVAVTTIPEKTLPEPVVSAQFLEDVTFPDGASVDSRSRVVKTWRIQNNGNVAWPEGVVLVCCGGDQLTPLDLAIPVASICPNEDIEVSVMLAIPEMTGRHVAYFRLQLANGNFLGPRLWADIRVKESDVDWHVVSNVMHNSINLSNATAPLLQFDAPDEYPPVFDDSSAVRDEDLAPAPIVAEDVDSDEEREEIVAVSSTSSSTDSNTWGWQREWSAELAQVEEMGFPITDSLLPLLQQFLHVPVSMSSGKINEAGMQRVIASLLEF